MTMFPVGSHIVIDTPSPPVEDMNSSGPWIEYVVSGAGDGVVPKGLSQPESSSKGVEILPTGLKPVTSLMASVDGCALIAKPRSRLFSAPPVTFITVAPAINRTCRKAVLPSVWNLG